MKDITIIISDLTRSGGTERTVATLANMLVHQGYKITVISLQDVDVYTPAFHLDNAVNVVFFKQGRVSHSFIRKIYWSLSTIHALRKYFRSIDTDILLSTGHGVSSLLPLVKRNKKQKIVAWEHIVFDSIPLLSRLYMRFLYRLLDSIVVLSKKAGESYRHIKNVVVIPNAIPFVVTTQSECTHKNILIVGRISPEKGLERLISVAKIIQEKYPEWTFMIVGDGDCRQSLEILCRTEGLRNINFVGRQKEVIEYYLKSSIYVMTSHFEAFPMVLLEAQGCGLPVVAFNCPEGPSQIIHHDIDGYLVENNNIELFAQYLCKLMTSLTLRKKLGVNGYINSQKYSEEQVFVQWEKFFATLFSE